MMNEMVARAVGVFRRYGPVTALDAVDLDIAAGELVGLLGPNGAGKTTLVNLFTGLRRPSAGRVELDGKDPRTAAARKVLGMTPQETGLPATLKVGEVVDFVAAHFPDPLGKAELLERFGLTGLERRQTGGLSGGQRRRLAVALAFAGRPKVVFLDEPTTGLDVEARRALWEGISEFHADGGTVVLTTHYLEEVEALASRVVVLAGGRVVADGSVESIRGLVGLRRVTFKSPVDPGPAGLAGLAGLAGFPGVRRAEYANGAAEVVTADSDRFVRDLVAGGVPFRDLEISGTSLEDAFVSLVQEGAR